MSIQTNNSKVEKYLAVGLIIVVAFIAYAPLISSFGYYLDDWYVVWAERVFGPKMIIEFHQFDRPLQGYFYALFFRLLGNHLLAWQVFALFLRLVGALSFLWVLRKLWPNSFLITTSAALLLVVYPGFLQQPNALVYSNLIFPLTIALISISSTVKAASSTPKWEISIYQFLSIFCTATYLFYIEFFIGLEFLRWAFLWIAIKKLDAEKSLKAMIKHWLQLAIPSLMIIIGMIGWRLLVFDSGRKSMNVSSIVENFVGSLSHSIAGLIIETGRDFIETVFSAWFVPAYQMSVGASYRDWVISIVLALIAVILFLGYVIFIRKLSVSDSWEIELKRSLFWVGFLGVIVLLFPVVAVGRQVYLDLIFNGFNRYTLHVSVGVSLLIIGSLLMGTNRVGFIGMISLLLAFAIHTHFFNGLRYQLAWQYEKDLWWQMTWRVPDLEDDTMLTAMLPTEFPFVESTQIWAPANIIYRSDSQELKIKGEILNTETIGRFQRDVSDEKVIRGVIPMPRNYENTLIITIPDSLSCLHVIDGERLEDYREHPLVKLISEKSHLDQIITETNFAITPPTEIFGPEPDRTWCYYFQKISLARQRQDWDVAALLADQASEFGYKPLNRSEWIPVFEAYVNVNRLAEAKHLATIIKDEKDLKYLYCQQSPDINGLAYSLICGN